MASASIVIRAPAANDRVNVVAAGGRLSKVEYPIREARPDTKTTDSHSQKIDDLFHLACLRSLVAAIASGRFDINTATNIPALMVPPPIRFMPSTIDSGTPSRAVPTNIATGDVA